MHIHKTDAAEPKLAFRFKRTNSSHLSQHSVLSLLLGQRTWPVHLYILSTKHNALYKAGTDKYLPPHDWCFGKLTFWVTSFILSILH